MAWNWLLGLLGHQQPDDRRESAEDLEPADREGNPEPGDGDHRLDDESHDPDDAGPETADAESVAEDVPDPDPDADEFEALDPVPLDEPDESDPGEPDPVGERSVAESTDEADDDPNPTDEAVSELSYRTEELEEAIEDTEMRLDAIQDSQEQVVSQVDELNDRVRRLLGLYDQATDDINPFTGEGEADNGFEVFGGTSTDGGEETISFDDLKSDVGSEPDDSVAEPDPEPTPKPGPSADPPRPEDPADGPTLRELPDSYAADVVVFEWLGSLLESGGPRATLEALSYYVELGWIGEDVRAHLEGVLAGPGIAPDADDSAELTSEDHADSYAYIVQLSEIGEIERTVEP